VLSVKWQFFSLWSNGQNSWLQIQRSRFDFRRYEIFWEVVGPERGPLSLLSTNEELLERKSSGFSLENRDYGRRDQSRWPRGTLDPQNLALTSPTIGGRSVSIVRSRTQATEYFLSESLHTAVPRLWLISGNFNWSSLIWFFGIT
jgi:hypothetical protein